MRWTTRITAAGLAVTSLVSWGLASAGRAAAQEPPPASPSIPQTISVVGVGEAAGSPDMAFVQLGVETRDPDIRTALGQADERMNAVRDALAGQGIAADDIQTTNYNVYQELYGTPLPPPTPSDQAESTTQPAENLGVYVVSNIVQIKVRQIDQVSAVIQAALDAGANRVYGLTFGLEDTTALENQARQAAADNARQRAEALASAFGVTLGNVIAISEGGASAPPYLPSARFDMKAASGPVISQGQLSVTLQIVVTFALIP